VSQSSDDSPTGPIRGGAPSAAALPPPANPGHGPADPAPQRNVKRDLIAAALLVIGAVLPWNLSFGVGIPNSDMWIFVALGAVTLLSLIALALPVGRVRRVLNDPYWLLVLGFVGWNVWKTIQDGGTVNVPGGIGPGAWVGIAGSLLSVQPVVAGPAADGERPSGGLRVAQIIGYASIVGAALNTAFNLFWQVKFGLRTEPGVDFGKQNIAVIATATVYGLVSLAAVVVASRWLLKNTRASQLATSALGASVLLAGAVVWLLPVGREIDAFHGIAQNTSVAGVGFEGYLAWAAAAAIFAPRALPRRRGGKPGDENPWRVAVRQGLTLIIVWSLGTALLKLTAFAANVALNYPYSRYDSLTMTAFDVITAVLAIWLRRKLAGSPGSARLITWLAGLIVTFGIARVVVGVVLAPRFPVPPEGAWSNPVYGNDLAQQITSTFDVVLCGLALAILFAALTGRLTGRRRRRKATPAAHGRNARPAVPTAKPAAPAAPPPPPPSAAATSVIQLGGAGPGRQANAGAVPQLAGSGAPRIFRGDDSATRQISLRPPTGPAPKIYRPPQDPGQNG